MRNIVLAALAASTAFGIATPALAQDEPAKPAFDGFRVGAEIGYDSLRPGSSQQSSISDDNKADGLLYGGDIGYDKTIGSNFVIGAEAGISGSTSKASNDPTNPSDIGFGRVKAGRDIYVGARIGTLLSPRTLLYAKGGYTNARLDLTASNGTTETGQSYNLDGYRVGAGIEHAIGSNTYAKIEYRYSNYSNARLEYVNGANTNNFSVDTDRHQIVAGVGFRF